MSQSGPRTRVQRAAYLGAVRRYVERKRREDRERVRRVREFDRGERWCL